jgi:hypothetical protein
MTRRPNTRETLAALRVVADALEIGAAFQVEGEFFFDLGGDWYFSLSPDDAGRFRLRAWHGATPVGRMWALTGDLGRLAILAHDLRTEIQALA